MTDEYKSNSHKSKEVDERKKVGKVVKGKVSIGCICPKDVEC